MQHATVVPPHGLYPIGGKVDGVDQAQEHGDAANELTGDAKVTVTATRTARVVTWGGHHHGEPVAVVSIRGRAGWYAASGFKFG